MKNISYKFLDYNNEKENYLYSSIEKISSDKDTLVITESGMAKNYYFAYINKSIFDVRDNLISFDIFWENIFTTDKKVLKDIKRFFLFYSCLNDDMKSKLNINSYFDCIEIADDFFEFFTNIKDKVEIKKLNLSKWQEEKFNIFFEIKNEFDKLADENNYLPSDWLATRDNLDFSFLNKYNKLVFFDIVDFPDNFSKIIKILAENFSIDIILQIPEQDFDKENFKINKLSLIDREISFDLFKYTNELELYNKIKVETERNYFSVDLTKEDKYSIFSQSNKFYLNDTKFYQLIEGYLALLNEVDVRNKNLINIFTVKKNIFKNSFMSFYGLDVQDYKDFEEIVSQGYQYISLELVENGYYDYYLNENENLKQKLKKILSTVSEIEKIKTVADLNEFLCNKFFNEKADIDFFIEDKFDSLFDKIYEILGLLNSNENIDFFKNFNKFFTNNLGKNIFTLFFNYLNKITIYSSQNIKNEKSSLKDFYALKFNKQSPKNISILDVDNKTLPHIKTNNNLFTEKQKRELGLRTNDDILLIEKYRFLQNIYCINDFKFCSIVDEENNIDYSDFIYELRNKYFSKEDEAINMREFFQNLYEENKNENFTKDKLIFRPYSKEITDFKNQSLVLGAYDYSNLIKDETFYFLDKICGIKSRDETEPVNGIATNTLGNIVHKTMEKIFKDKWKAILNSAENLLVSEEEIKEYLVSSIKNEKLKIENFMDNYIDSVLIPRFISNIKKFLLVLHNELKDKKIMRIEAEKAARTKTVSYLKHKGVEVFFNGRADLIIETDKARYIIDFKTGKANKEQLIFYALMFYGTDESLQIYSTAYNLWEEDTGKDTDKELDLSKALIKDIKNEDQKFREKLINFLDTDFYVLPRESKLKENEYNFKQYYRYNKLIPLDKIEKSNNSGDKDE